MKQHRRLWLNLPRSSRTTVSRGGGRWVECGCGCWTRLTLLQDPSGSSLLAAPCSRSAPFPSAGPYRARAGSGRSRPASSRQRPPPATTPLRHLRLPGPSETWRVGTAARAPPSWSAPGCCREQSKLKGCGGREPLRRRQAPFFSSGGASPRRRTTMDQHSEL